MRRLLYFLLILLIPSVSAIIDINSTDIGCDYIRWNWTDGLDVSDIYIDGVATCGYETTLNTTLVTGLGPGETHRIDVFTATDTGFNITSTSPILSCLIPSGGGGGSNDNSSYLLVGLAIGLLLTILYLRRQT
jgi:hypothetical protein